MYQKKQYEYRTCIYSFFNKTWYYKPGLLKIQIPLFLHISILVYYYNMQVLVIYSTYNKSVLLICNLYLRGNIDHK